MPRLPEDEVILSLARFDPRLPKERIVSLLSSARLNWSKFLKECRFHGVSPLIYHNARALDLIPLFPRSVVKNLKKDFVRASAFNLLFSKALQDILVTMADKRIPVIPMKGCLFMFTLYPTIALRPMIDIDLLVKERDFSRASRALNDIGYKQFFDPHRPHSAREYYAMAFLNKEKVVVELHRALYERFSPSMDMDGVWTRSKRIRVAGQKVWSMSTEDTIIFLCLHLAQHDFRIRLLSLVDLTEIIVQRGNRIRWDLIVSAAAAQGVRTPVYLALVLLKEWFGAKIPVSVFVKLTPSFIKRAYLSWLFDPESLRFLRWNLPVRLIQTFLLPVMIERPSDSLRFLASYLGLRIRDSLTRKKIT